jgi:hypothetical protein
VSLSWRDAEQWVDAVFQVLAKQVARQLTDFLAASIRFITLTGAVVGCLPRRPRLSCKPLAPVENVNRSHFADDRDGVTPLMDCLSDPLKGDPALVPD